MEDLIRRFYEALKAKDALAIRACYHPEAKFDDPVFDLKGAGHWEAVYTFSASGRRVHNKMDSAFAFKDGKIIGHRDHFAFWRWSRQALGLSGLLLGWSPFLKAKVRARARGNLDKFLASHPEYR